MRIEDRIKRYVYDGEYDRAILLLLNNMLEQERRIKELESKCLQVNTEEPSGQKTN